MEGINGFLRDLLHEGFRTKVLDTDQFLGIVTPQMIMRGFEDHPKLRKKILTEVSGLDESIALLLEPEP